jgi:hypothetical protein
VNRRMFYSVYLIGCKCQVGAYSLKRQWVELSMQTPDHTSRTPSKWQVDPLSTVLHGWRIMCFLFFLIQLYSYCSLLQMMTLRVATEPIIRYILYSGVMRSVDSNFKPLRGGSKKIGLNSHGCAYFNFVARTKVS